MLSSSVTSFSMSLKARPSAARKQTEPVPVGWTSIEACRVSEAVGSPNSASRLGATGLVRPRIVSRNPTSRSSWLGAAPGTGAAGICLRLLAQLPGDLGQLLQPPVQRGVRGEQPGQGDHGAALGERGREVERVQRLGGTQVPGRDAGYVAGDLLQRAGQRRGLAGEQRP